MGSAAFFGAAGTCARAAAAAVPHGPARLKLAVLSDIHVTGRDGTQRKWEAALRKVDAWGADGLLVCGDLADWGLDVQLEVVAESWFKVFPGGRRSDGAPIANLIHYGDHDTSGYTYRGCPPCAAAWPDEEQMKKHILRWIDRKAAWERCFKEEWAPIVKKTVKGYDFILSHFTKGEKGNGAGDNVPGLAEFLAQANLDPSRPFFYSQHRIPRNTACGPHAWGQDDGQTTKLFSAKYPNCFAFCGHCHMAASEERSIWQGGFTCVEVPSLSYSVTQGGRENGYSCWDSSEFRKPALSMPPAGCGPRSAGMFVTVHDDAIVLRRWNFHDDAQIGSDWIVPLPLLREKPYSHEYRAAHDPAPEFPDGAKVVYRKTHGKDRLGVEQDFITVEFPMALETASTPRANDYEVQIELLRCDITHVVGSRRVYSPLYGRASALDHEPVKCNIPLADIPAPGFQKVRFAVRPVNSFGRKGRALYADYRLPKA